MSRVWGRDETYRWPSDKPVWTITVLVVMGPGIFEPN
jgi:hypothetical protein